MDSSEDSDNGALPRAKLFGRERPIYDALGGGKGTDKTVDRLLSKTVQTVTFCFYESTCLDLVDQRVTRVFSGFAVADVLLWRDKRTSAAILFAVAVVWFLFEVVDYSFITLLCHIFITTMLVIFIWCTGAEILKWTPPNIPKIMLKDSTFREAALSFHAKFNKCLEKLFFVACGNDPKLFILAIFSLWILSLVGNYVGTVNLLFFGLLCLGTLPFSYEQYEVEVDDLASKLFRRMRRMYKKFEANVPGKIPRKPGKDEKVM